ncbi:MAG: hypothetical protein WCP32_08460, partial [Bacteroidota bacterium]
DTDNKAEGNSVRCIRDGNIITPYVTTTTVSSIQSLSAISGGTATFDGGSAVTMRGVCWSIQPNPTIADNHSSDGIGSGGFVSSIIGLTPATMYYVRAYATNAQGTVYGNQVTFTSSCASFAPVSISITSDVNPSCTGNPVTFTSTISNGGANPQYQWKKGGTNISGATGPTYTYIPLSGDVIICILTSNLTCTTSNPATSNSATNILHHLATSPVSGTHLAGLTEITWSWNTDPGVIGYKWNYINEYASATDLGSVISKTETGLICNNSYTRYVWAYNACGNSTSTVLTKSTTSAILTSPVAGVHISSPSQIIWNWNNTSGATGYKWNSTPDFNSAIDVGPNTSYIETGAICNGLHTRYIWSYNLCGKSNPTTLTQENWTNEPSSPMAGTQIPTQNQIIWNWNITQGATGYKWNTENNYTTAILMGSTTTKTESGLSCGTTYTRYVWAIGSCGNSQPTILIQSTLQTIASPIANLHLTNFTQITWRWNSVVAASGYKWNTINDYNSATGISTNLQYTETGLFPNNVYTRYVWAYFNCGISIPTVLTQTTPSNGVILIVNHLAGVVSPVSKTVSYTTVCNVGGELNKCWIAQNLGADQQATAVNDATEPSAGWYWQFNKKQGYKHDGTNRIPNTTWISSINENSDWQVSNDPCAIEIGNGWRLPTKTEWTNVLEGGSWTDWNGPWNSPLKLHFAGHLISWDSGHLYSRGTYGNYWSATQFSNLIQGYSFWMGNINSCNVGNDDKAMGNTIRCIKD